MLVLARCMDESIIINGNIEVMITDVNKKTGKVRLGITAPRNISIYRKEVQTQIDKDKEESNAIKSNNTNSTP